MYRRKLGGTDNCDRRDVTSLKWARSSILAAVLVVSLVALPAIASANHGGIDSLLPTADIPAPCFDSSVNNGTICKADNKTHTVSVEALGPKMAAATTFTLTQSYDTTDLKVVFQTGNQVSYSGCCETDVIYQFQNTLPGNVIARTWCEDAISSTKCDQHYVGYNGLWLGANIPNNVQKQRSLACHETGHTVGLVHGSDSTPAQNNNDPNYQCMRSPLNSVFTMGPHNAQQVNANY